MGHGYMPDEPRRLNEPLIRAMMLGAGIERDSVLAERVGVNKSQLSRALRGGPLSVRMIDGLLRLWPSVPYHLLVIAPGDEEHARPEAHGLTEERLSDLREQQESDDDVVSAPAATTEATEEATEEGGVVDP